MLNKLKPKSEFSRNILTLMTGTSIAQAIPIAISPILTRIYSPEEFGVFALYMGMVSIISILATGRYDLAIMMPKKDSDAMNIVALSAMITTIISIIVLFIVVVFNAEIMLLFDNESIANWLYFIPISLFFIGIYQSLNCWSNRMKQYKRLAVNRVLQSSSTATINVSFPFGGFNFNGLITSGIIAQVLATSVLFKKVFKVDSDKLKHIKKLKIIALAKKYISFPKYVLASEFVTVLLFQIPIFFLSIFVNTTMVGFYNLVQRTLGLPVSMLSRSISEVFKQKATSDYNETGNCKHIYLKTFKMLLLLGFIPFSVLFFLAPTLFSFIFGPNWIIAGEFAQILSIMFFLKFVSSPLSYMFIIVHKQKYDLYFHIYLLLSTFSIFYFSEGIKAILLNYSINYSMIYIIYIIISYNYSKGKTHENN